MSITKPRPRRALALLCALALCAFAAPSVAQAANGTTAFTCVKGGLFDHKDPHCAEKVGIGTGEYGHETIAVDTNTKTHFQSTLASITFSGTIATIKAKITCTGMTGTGFLQNEEPIPGHHTVTGSEIELTYTGCDAKIGKAEITCTVVGGEFEFPALKAMDVENAHGFEMGIKFEPEVGPVLGVVVLGADCPVAGPFNIEGSMLGVPHGATLEFTEASTKPTMTLGGNAASHRDTWKLGMLNEKFNETENPIGFTTTGE
jgi:hypothetical protein